MDPLLQIRLAHDRLLLETVHVEGELRDGKVDGDPVHEELERVTPPSRDADRARPHGPYRAVMPDFLVEAAARDRPVEPQEGRPPRKIEAAQQAARRRLGRLERGASNRPCGGAPGLAGAAGIRLTEKQE